MQVENPGEKVSPTAWMIAYRRTFTDIPYSQDIFQELELLRQAQGEEAIPDEQRTPQIAPQIEARYKLVSRLMKESGITQMFELAAGLSPHGLDMTANPAISYVESDLLGMSLQKQTILHALKEKRKITERPNLRLAVANALDGVSMQAAIVHFDHAKPIIIMHEGLLRYLNFDQKAIVARNVHALLKQCGGLWITPDITQRKLIQAENDATANKVDVVHQKTGINIEQNSFESVDDAQRFFERLGFGVEQHSYHEVIDDLVSPHILGQSKEQVEALIKNAVVFVMRVA